jgi:hypothetical protein
VVLSAGFVVVLRVRAVPPFPVVLRGVPVDDRLERAAEVRVVARVERVVEAMGGVLFWVGAARVERR